MTRLTTLKPAIGRLSTAVTSADPQEDTRDMRRYAAAPWRRWYGLKRWKDLRWRVLVDALFQCQRCGLIEGDTSKLVADHRVPHRGRDYLFWDRENLTCLCKSCHDAVKQREEQAEIVGNWD